jgi:hypothetical protein
MTHLCTKNTLACMHSRHPRPQILERGLKYGTTSEADQKKLEALRRQQEAVKEKQRLALDKVKN